MDVEKKLLGVMGGLGPMATTHFMELVIRMTDAETDQQNLDMIVYNFPSIPDRTGYILGYNLRSPLPGLLSVGRALTRQGAAYVAIPCVTAHYFYDALTSAIPIPIINVVEETVLRLKEQGITSVGIMATDGTISAGLFTMELKRNDIRVVLPSEPRQADVMHLIYRDIKAGRTPDMARFRAVEAELRENGAEAIILGCTELSLIKRDHDLGPGFLDTMEVLAQRSVQLCGGTLKEEYRNLIQI